MEKIKKTISPIAINALLEALSNIYWYKKDLRIFLTQLLSNPYIISQLNWDDYKRNIISSLVTFLAKNQEKYQDDLIKLMNEVCNMNDFSHLERVEDGKAKAKKAEATVIALRKQFAGYHALKEEKEKVEERKKLHVEKIATLNNIQGKLDEIKIDFYDLVGSTNAQARGFKLEKIIKELFSLFDLDPKASFRIQGEQIDGAFTFDNNDYLFEGKWQAELCGIQDLDAFNGKVGRKLDNTLGLFCSINGFSPTAVQAYSAGKLLLLLMDGQDLMAVLDGRIDLPQLLLRKRRHAAQTGNIYLTAAEIFTNA